MATRKSPRTGLAAEIQQSKPFESLEVEAYLNLIRTAFQFAGEAKQVCRTAGITEPQYNVLRILRGAGPDGWPCGEVAPRMVSRLPDVSRLLDRLELSGLVRKQPGTDDKRVVRVTITAKGRRILDRLDGPLVQLHQRQLAHFTDDELNELNRLLAKARAAESNQTPQ